MEGGVVVLGDLFPVSESCLELVLRHVFYEFSLVL